MDAPAPLQARRRRYLAETRRPDRQAGHGKRKVRGTASQRLRRDHRVQPAPTPVSLRRAATSWTSRLDPVRVDDGRLPLRTSRALTCTLRGERTTSARGSRVGGLQSLRQRVRRVRDSAAVHYSGQPLRAACWSVRAARPEIPMARGGTCGDRLGLIRRLWAAMDAADLLDVTPHLPRRRRSATLRPVPTINAGMSAAGGAPSADTSPNPPLPLRLLRASPYLNQTDRWHPQGRWHYSRSR